MKPHYNFKDTQKDIKMQSFGSLALSPVQVVCHVLLFLALIKKKRSLFFLPFACLTHQKRLGKPSTPPKKRPI